MASCCFTGHRSYKLGLDNSASLNLKKKLKEVILGMAEEGINVFYTGMAQGIDLWAAAAVIEVRREKNNVRLISAVPFYGQENGWSLQDRVEYLRILDACDESYILSTSYYPKCYFVRNEFMVDRCERVLAVYNGKGGGTKYTVDYALRQEKQVVIINPFTFEVHKTGKWD